jgi:hypothetical protein
VSQYSGNDVQTLRARLEAIGPHLQARVSRGELTLAQAERRLRTTVVKLRRGTWVGRIRKV